MPGEYKVRVTSRSTASVGDIPLQSAERETSALTRKIARVTLVDNIHDKSAGVQLCLMHQRRNVVSSEWQDANSYNLAHVKAGEQVRLALDSGETIRLFEALSDQYHIAHELLPGEPEQDEDGHIWIQATPYEKRIAVVDADEVYVATGREREVIERLLQQTNVGFWAILEELEPNLLQSMAAARTHRIRSAALGEFREQMEKQQWAEGEWDSFFKRNKWIFGYGLDYRFLSEIESQPNYGGTDVSGHGGQRGDFLMASDAQMRFTVLVEIKKPGSPLVTHNEYRNRVYELGKDLVGGVTQLQSNCRTWELEGSQTGPNRERLEGEATYTIQPKGILVVGHTQQLDSYNKRITFEVFRQNLHNPQILTYDELLARAEYLVSHDAATLDEGLPAKLNDAELDVDDILF